MSPGSVPAEEFITDDVSLLRTDEAGGSARSSRSSDYDEYSLRTSLSPVYVGSEGNGHG